MHTRMILVDLRKASDNLDMVKYFGFEETCIFTKYTIFGKLKML